MIKRMKRKLAISLIICSPIMLLGCTRQPSSTSVVPPSTSVIEMALVTFQNYDDQYLWSTEVEIGKGVIYQGPEPTHASDERYVYHFSGWNGNLEKIVEDTIFTALFEKEEKTMEYHSVGEKVEGQLISTKKAFYADPCGEYISLDVKEDEEYRIQGYSWDKEADVNQFTAFFVCDQEGNYIVGSSYSEQRKENSIFERKCQDYLYTIPKGGSTLYVLGHTALLSAKIEKKVYVEPWKLTGLFLGDSLVQGVGVLPKESATLPEDDAVSVMERKLQSTIRNGGIGGTTYARPFHRKEYDKNSTYTSFADMVDELILGEYHTISHHIDKNATSYPNEGFDGALVQYERISKINLQDLKYICIAYGTNDWYAGTMLDSNINDEDTSTVLGAFRYGIRKLKTFLPHVSIVVYTPCYREKLGENRDENSNTYVQPNTHLTLEQFGDAIFTCALSLQKELGDVYAKNMYQNPNLNQEHAEQYLKKDGTHYNKEGYQVLGTLYADFIIELQEKGYLN